MNIDFHYYATYVAARLAGYGFAEAQTIAHAAQYVDDSTLGMLRNGQGDYYIKDFTPVPTVQSLKELLLFDTTEWSGSNLLKTYNVWIPFHFLPGNYGRPDVLAYTGPKSDSARLSKWSFTEESENHFNLLCQPNSLLVEEMVNDLIDHHDNDLHFVGLRLHVLADTWAHFYYAGIPAWYMNNAGEMVNEIDAERRKKPVKWRRVWPLTDLFNAEEATPNMPYYNSYVYHGHGRMGHLPDYPYIEYEYQPQWSVTSVIKDNRSRFLEAFKQLVMAMQCIRKRKTFDTNTYAQLDPQVEEVVKGVLTTRKTDQCDTWKTNIPKIVIDGNPLELPEEYQTDKWLSAFKEAGGHGVNTDYYKFNQAAVQHLNLVAHHLESHGQFIMSGDSGKNTITVKLKTEKGAYIGAMSESNYAGVTTQYYAKMSSEAVPHKIIKIDGEPLRSGAIVQIKTTEAKTGEYAYLGAWNTPALYYYKKDYEVDKQRWEIEKVDLSKDDIIRQGHRVRIKNLHYTSKPYMASYTYIFDRQDYLTTRGKAAEWILEATE